MNLFTSKLITTISAVVILFTTPTLLSAQELNLNGFSGTMSTTITSGVTVRTEDNNCLLQDGYNYTRASTDLTGTGQYVLAGKSAAIQAAVLADATKNDAGCASVRVDGYGNTSTNHLAIGDVNSDDGKLNFPNSVR